MVRAQLESTHVHEVIVTDLPTRKLGRTGVEVSVLGFGAMELRGAARSGYRARSAMQDRWESAKLDELLGGLSRIELTLRFTLPHPGLSTTIVGTRNPEHLRQNLEAAKQGPLPSELVAKIKQRLDASARSPGLPA